MRFILCVALIIFGIVIGGSIFKSIFYPVDYQDIIHRYSKKYNLDEYMVMAVIKTESNFVSDAHSGKASGLMQLTDDTAKWVCDKLDIDYENIDLFKPSDNIRLGCYYLRHLIDKYDGNINVALAAYNGGPGNVGKWLDNEKYSNNGVDLHHIPFKETREYVIKVNKQWDIYKELYEREPKD